jgi:hypothetical protein
MNMTFTTRIPRLGQGGWRRRDVPMVLAAAGLAALAAGCSRGPAQPGSASSPAAGGQHSSASGTNDHLSTNGRGGQGNNMSTGVFSLAFARCMRANGVPDFPDPNGQGGQLSPASGIDPNSPAFQAALNGPCKSLAPRGWINSGTGPVTR